MKKINLKNKVFLGLISTLSLASLGIGLGLTNHYHSVPLNQNSQTCLQHNGFSLLVPNSDQAVNINNLSYLLNPQSLTATLIGFSNATNNPSSLVIPGLVNYQNQNYVVNNIASGAFYNKQINSVSFPESIQTIGADAFADNQLTNLELPNNLVSLGNNAFSNNWFTYGTVIYLPSNCTWSKIGSLCPFPSNLNYGKLVPSVQFIIQNQAVYEYDGVSGNWNIQSYLPSVANNQPNNVKFNNHLFAKRSNDDTTSPTDLHYSYSKTNLPVNSSLETTRIVFKTKKWYDGNLSFINNQIQLNPNTPGNVSGFNNVKMRIYSLSSESTLFDNSLSQLKNNTITLHNGDIITLYSSPNAYANIYTQVPTNVDLNSNNYGSYNIFYNLGLSNFNDRGPQTNFMVTPSGLVPYQSITTLHQNVLNAESNSKTTTVTGHSLANHKITITYNQTTLTVDSDNNGNFSFDIPTNTPLNTMVTVSCSGTLPISFKLIGANPIQSGILFNVLYDPVGIKNYVQFGICPNGATNKFEIWNSNNTTMPDYNNPNPGVTSNYFTNNAQWGLGGTWFLGLAKGYLNITNQIYNGSHLLKTYQISIDMSQVQTPQDIQNQLNQLTYDPQYQNVLTISVPHNSNWIMGGMSNNAFVNSGSEPNVMVNKQNSDQYRFTITNNQIVSDIPYNHTALGCARQWNATNDFMVGQIGGQVIVNNDSANWDDPTPQMYQVVHNITANLQTTYQKAVAIAQWVNQNMHYSYSYDYNHNISDTFNKQEGICGDYASLTAVMCQMAGLVARVIVGECGQALNYFDNPITTDHSWMQVWDEQIGEWITLDPTWNWYAPYGQIQSSFNFGRSDQRVVIVLWPKGTNYFSYFKNYEYEALNKLGQFYCVAQNSVGNLYPISYAINLTNLLNTAWTLKDDQYAYVVNNNLTQK